MNAPRPGTGRSCPDELPMLGVGPHRGPQDGACVMEYASVLAGERFGDHPRCVHPALAGLARGVNDRIRDDGLRGRLALLVPDLIAVDEQDPRVGPTVEVACLRAAAAGRPLPRWAARRLERLSRRLGRTGEVESRIRHALRQAWWMLDPPGGVARHALLFFETHALKAAVDRDWRLYELMCAVVSDCVRLTDARRTERSVRTTAP